MGFVHELCHVSGLSLETEMVNIVLVGKMGESYLPIAPPIIGTYDGYGKIKKWGAMSDYEVTMLQGLIDLNKRGEIDFPQAHDFCSQVSTDNMLAFIEDIRQGMILSEAHSGDESRLVKAKGIPLGFVFILNNIYNSIVEIKRNESQEKYKDFEDFEFSALSQKSLGLPGLSPLLVQDSNNTRYQLAALIYFRSWFDSRKSWNPPKSYVFKPNEMEIRIKIARQELGSSPELMKAIDHYEEYYRGRETLLSKMLDDE